jgi:hypothetical protein
VPGITAKEAVNSGASQTGAGADATASRKAWAGLQNCCDQSSAHQTSARGGQSGLRAGASHYLVVLAVGPDIDPAPQFLRSCDPITLIDPPPQRGSLEPPHPEVDREIHNGREPSLWLSSKDRTVAQRGTQRDGHIGSKISFALCHSDRRMLGIAKMAIADGPKTR